MAEKKLFYPFIVEPFQEDYTGHLAWSTLGNLILRVSSLHAETHNFGFTYMQTHHRGWVLSRLVLELDHLPLSGKRYQLGTWVNRIYRHFTDRLYVVTDPNGVPFGYGTSTWALIDYETRQPVNLETLPDGGFHQALLDEDVPIDGPSRARVQETEPVLRHTAAYTDLDINGHFNSIRYIDLLLNTFDKDWHDTHTVRRIEMAYGLEAYAGQQLRVYRHTLSDDRVAFEVRRPTEDGKSESVLVRAVLTVKTRN